MITTYRTKQDNQQEEHTQIQQSKQIYSQILPFYPPVLYDYEGSKARRLKTPLSLRLIPQHETINQPPTKARPSTFPRPSSSAATDVEIPRSAKSSLRGLFPDATSFANDRWALLAYNCPRLHG